MMMSPEMKKCLEACSTCAWECESCATACLEEPDVKAREMCIKLLRDCADICVLSAQWMSRGSKYAQALCSLCAEICDACGAECAKFKDEHCQRCAQTCRMCAEECRRMVKQPAMAR